MKTTLDLLRRLKLRAVREDRTLKGLVAELLQRGLASDTREARTPAHRVRLPLIEGGRPATPDTEMTPERVAAILLDEDARCAAQP